MCHVFFACHLQSACIVRAMSSCVLSSGIPSGSGTMCWRWLKDEEQDTRAKMMEEGRKFLCPICKDELA